MDKSFSSLDWSLVQAFLAVAETGSLSAAARVTGVSQPTLGRQIRQIEADLNATLFHRQPRGLDLSEIGQLLLPAAQAMRTAAGQMALIAAGQDQTLEGDVRLTASMIVAHFVLPPILADIRTREPGIRIDLVASDTSENLLFREADIAIRMYQPRQMDVITRHVADLPLGLYAAKSYLDRVGHPESVEDLLALDQVGYDRDDRLIRGMQQMHWQVTRNSFHVRTDDQAANWHLIRAGCGIGVGQVAAARGDTTLVRLFPELPLPSLPVWLTAHEAMRRTPRLRRVWDLLAGALPAAVS